MPPSQTTAARPRKKPASKKNASLTPEQVAERLHQTICQSITGVRFLVSAIGQQLPPEATDLLAQLKYVDTALDESCEELRKLISELRTASGKDFTAEG